MPDIVTSYSTSVAIALNLGGRSFAESVGHSVRAGGYGTALADMNQDGALDIVVMGGNLLTLMLNDQ